MAGRGVDIKLGGANEAENKRVREAGGLFVIGTGFNRSIRIDYQLRGRAGRQGDIGESCFFVSLEDELLKEASCEPFNLLRNKEKDLYERLVNKAGKKGVSLAEKQLLLYFTNLHWAEYLESMEYVRDGKAIEADVLHGLKTYEITESGIDMEAAGLGNATRQNSIPFYHAMIRALYLNFRPVSQELRFDP